MRGLAISNINSDSQPDWTTPKLALLAPPSFSVAYSDVGVVILNCGSFKITAYTSVTSGGSLGRSRSIVTFSDHIEVHDTFTNNDPTTTFGIHLRHFVASSSAYVHLAGALNPTGGDVASAWNPTAFTPLGTAAGVGLVMEDDTFRIQGRVDKKTVSGSAITVGIKTDQLAFAAGGSATLIWSIYPTASNNYYDFINRVRANWSVNYQVQGPYFWFDPDTVIAMDPTALANALAQQGVNVAVLGGGWVDPQDGSNPKVIGFGNYVMSSFFASYRSRIVSAIAKLRAAKTGIKVILYFNAARESTPSADTVYSDSLETSITNAELTNTFGGLFTTAWNMVPTGTNSYGIAMQTTAADMVAASPTGLGADGVFWDEMETYSYTQGISSVSPGSPPVTFNVWDGTSALLTTPGKISSLMGEVDLLAQSSRLSMAGNFSFILGNSPPLLRAWTNRRDMRMVEIQTNTGNAAFAHLTTPLGYISTQTGWIWIQNAINNAVLPISQLLQVVMGSLPAVSYQIMPRLYPLTPEFIQPGTVRGSERLITTTSGTHGWKEGGTGVNQWRYDSSGQEHPGTWTVTNDSNGLLVQVVLAANEVAVIERIP